MKKLSNISEIAHELNQGRVLVYPTETVWGIGSLITFEDSQDEIYRFKNRPLERALSVLVRDIEMAHFYGHIDDKSEKFLKSVWPGAVTVVVMAKETVPFKIHGGTNCIGMRCSPHPFIKSLFQDIKVPLTTTSANLSGEAVVEKGVELNGPESWICVTNENALGEAPSTVVKLESGEMKLLRQGKVLFSDLEKIFQE